MDYLEGSRYFSEKHSEWSPVPKTSQEPVFKRLSNRQSRRTVKLPSKESSVSDYPYKIVPPRVEIKLHQRHLTSTHRLDELRRKKEEEELSQLQSKPCISKRSVQLAKQAERKFFEEYGLSPIDKKPHRSQRVSNSPINTSDQQNKKRVQKNGSVFVHAYNSIETFH